PEGTYLAELIEWAGKRVSKTDDNLGLRTEPEAVSIAQKLDTARYVVTKIEQKDRQEKAPPPFTTSTLQQTATTRLHSNAQRTMQTAQKLYEGVDLGSEGQVALITYMRTDSTRVSAEALTAVRGHVQAAYGSNYLPASANYFKSGKNAQEAHEAIRPTD